MAELTITKQKVPDCIFKYDCICSTKIVDIIQGKTKIPID